MENNVVECCFVTTLECFKKMYQDIQYTWPFMVGKNVFKYTSVPHTASNPYFRAILNSVRLVPQHVFVQKETKQINCLTRSLTKKCPCPSLCTSKTTDFIGLCQTQAYQVILPCQLNALKHLSHESASRNPSPAQILPCLTIFTNYWKACSNIASSGLILTQRNSIF